MGSRLESNSSAVRKRIEQHAFDNETGEEYEASKFGGFADYFRRKKIKLQNLDTERRRQNADKPPIFRGVVVHVNGYTQPSLNDLHVMIVDYGGGFLQYLDGKTMVTHVVAANLTLKKAEEFRKYRIVKPAWIVDSIKAGKMLPWSNYRVIDEGSQQHVLGLEGGAVKSQAGGLRQGYRDQTATSWYTSQMQDTAAQIDAELEPIPSDDAESPDPDEEPQAGAEAQNDIDESPKDTEAAFNASFAESFGLSGIDDADLLEAEGAHQVEEFSMNMTDGSPLQPLKESKSELHQGKEEPGEPPQPELFEAMGSPQAPIEEDEVTRPSSPSEQKNLTAEEHNAILLSDPKIWKSTVVNPGFLKQYYEESRLHHLSAWKAELKSRLQALAQERTSSQSARMKRPSGARRYVLHVDFDCFFAAVSLKQCPQYEDKPVVVAHGNGAGAEIACCNYVARKYGVKNGMWMRSAQDLCPTLKVLPYDFTAYEIASKEFYSAVIGTGGIVQSVSIDEALIDVSVACIEASGQNGVSTHEGSMYREQAKADEMAQALRDEIKQKTGCAVSVGIGGNILLAKVALRKAKPAGQYQIKPDEVLGFIGGLSVRDLPGVAYSIGGKLEDIGVKLVKDARELTKERLMNTLGPKTGEKIWEYSRGIDRVEVGEQVIRKSVSAEVNWGVRFVTQQQAEDFVRSLCEELHRRLDNEGVKGRQLTMKIMRRAADVGLDPPKHLGHGKCDVFNKSVVLGTLTNDDKILAREAISIMKGYGFPPGELRGIGVQMTKLEPLRDTRPLSGGQKRLQFSAAPQAAQQSPHLPEGEDDSDIIETPKKPNRVVRHPAAALGDPPGPDSGAPLNTFGTQFVLPSQVDTEVLAELPADIRLKFAGPAKNIRKDAPDPKQNTISFNSRSVSPAVAGGFALDVPSASQIDPETLAALPDDIRAEIESFYNNQTSPSAARQVRVPQSPHKSRIIKQPAKKATPTKKPRGRPRGIYANADPRSTLLQSNIVAARPSSSHAAVAEDSEIAPDVLAALPPDIRAEILVEQRTSRLQARGGLNVPARRQMRTDLELESDPRLVVLPPRLPRATFTAAQLSALPELREAVGQWVEALGGEGPDAEDVDTLVRYLGRVVTEERDMNKAVAVVRWLAWLVGELGPKGRVGWADAVLRVQQGVQAAVRERGLGVVRFE